MNDINNPSQEQVMTAGQILTNAGYNAASALQIRLEMNEVVAEFQKYLLAVDIRVINDPETGEPREVPIKIGESLVNEIGYQAMMGWINSVANKHTIMGNFLDDVWYGKYMHDLHLDVWCDLVVNREKYGITIRQLKPIMHKFIMFARMIMTRPIGDKERLGMNNTTRIQETTQNTQTQKGGFTNLGALFGKGGR